MLVLSPDNLKRRDRTPQDCGYYIEFKNGRTIRHDFDSSEDCHAFVATLNNEGETQPAVTEEADARAEQAAAELLAELGLDDSPNESPSGGNKTPRNPRRKKGAKRTRSRYSLSIRSLDMYQRRLHHDSWRQCNAREWIAKRCTKYKVNCRS